MPAQLSPDDTARFGVRAAKAFVRDPAEVASVVTFCRDNGVEFVIVRSDAADLGIAHALERERMELMDTLVYFSRSLRDWSPDSPPHGFAIRKTTDADRDTIVRLAKESFYGYSGHYHADPRLRREDCDAVYVDWSLRLCAPSEFPSTVLIATVDGAPSGFIALRARRGEPGEPVLGGVSIDARGRGVYTAMLASGLTWLRDQNCAETVVSTQIANIAVQKVWTRLGYAPHHAVYTFHGWF